MRVAMILTTPISMRIHNLGGCHEYADFWSRLPSWICVFMILSAAVNVRIHTLECRREFAYSYSWLPPWMCISMILTAALNMRIHDLDYRHEFGIHDYGFSHECYFAMLLGVIPSICVFKKAAFVRSSCDIPRYTVYHSICTHPKLSLSEGLSVSETVRPSIWKSYLRRSVSPFM